MKCLLRSFLPEILWFVLLEKQNRKDASFSSSSFFFFFFFFRASPLAYGSSWANGQIRAVATTLLTHSSTGSKPHLQPTAHGNARSLIHWARPASLRILVGFVTAKSWRELWKRHFFISLGNYYFKLLLFYHFKILNILTVICRILKTQFLLSLISQVP